MLYEVITSHRFGHAATATQREYHIGRHPIISQQLGNRDVVGVVGFQITIGIHYGIYRISYNFVLCTLYEVNTSTAQGIAAAVPAI